MTTTHTQDPAPVATADAVPARRTLVALSVTVLVALGAVFAAGADNEPDSSLDALEKTYDYSETMLRILSFGGMALCALLVFLGVAVRRPCGRGDRRGPPTSRCSASPWSA